MFIRRELWPDTRLHDRCLEVLTENDFCNYDTKLVVYDYITENQWQSLCWTSASKERRDLLRDKYSGKGSLMGLSKHKKGGVDRQQSLW